MNQRKFRKFFVNYARTERYKRYSMQAKIIKQGGQSIQVLRSPTFDKKVKEKKSNLKNLQVYKLRCIIILKFWVIQCMFQKQVKHEYKMSKIFLFHYFFFFSNWQQLTKYLNIQKTISTMLRILIPVNNPSMPPKKVEKGFDYFTYQNVYQILTVYQRSSISYSKMLMVFFDGIFRNW